MHLSFANGKVYILLVYLYMYTSACNNTLFLLRSVYIRAYLLSLSLLLMVQQVQIHPVITKASSTESKLIVILKMVMDIWALLCITAWAVMGGVVVLVFGAVLDVFADEVKNIYVRSNHIWLSCSSVHVFSSLQFSGMILTPFVS